MASALFLASVFCSLLHIGHFSPLGDVVAPLANGAGGAGNLVKGAGLAAGLTKAVGNCDVAEDKSCDGTSFTDMGNQIGEGMLGKGAAQGIGGVGRRRRGAGPLGGGGLPVSGLGLVEGGAFLTDPNLLASVQRKFKVCDDNAKQQSELQPKLDQMTSGNFKGIGSQYQSEVSDVGGACKKAMNTEKDKCDMMKRQSCAIMKGKVTDPSKVGCSAKDLMKTVGTIHAKDQSCETAKNLAANPKDAEGILKKGGTGVATGALLSKAG